MVVQKSADPMAEWCDFECEICGRGIPVYEAGYHIVVPQGKILRSYCSTKCLFTVVKEEVLK